MKLSNRVRNALKGFRADNSINMTGRALAEQFRRGNTPLLGDWSQLVMDESDKYTGYLYAAVNNRAKKVAMLGLEHLKTQSTKEDAEVTHPYLELITDSPDFTDYQFWYEVSTFLDLKGRYYLMAVRNFDDTKMGKVQKFKLMNPYNVRRVIDQRNGEIEGYVQGWRGMTREIPKQMVIEVDTLNPFSDTDPYSMTDAAKDSQFALKSAGDYSTHAVKKNINTPGIVTFNDEELALDPEKMKNFKARIQGHVKGEPIYGAGKGSITWNDMNIDLNKAALDKVSEVNLKALIAVTSNSKTVLGIEESGVTRDTSETQKNSFITDVAVPQTQLIIDALNQDYKNNYPSEYKSNKVKIKIDPPQLQDNEQVKTEEQVKRERYELYTTMLVDGYSAENAAMYADGELGLSELGEPKEPEPIEPQEPEPADQHIPAIKNQLTSEEQGVVTQQEGVLQNVVVNVQRELVGNILNRITKNKFENEQDIITKTEKRQRERELKAGLEAFYLVIIPLFGRRVMNRRKQEFNKAGIFRLNSAAKKRISGFATKASKSHIDTVVAQIHRDVQAKALEGATQQELISFVKGEFVQISDARAKAVARTETNRAFTQSQYQADLQFLQQNDLEGRAYKKWITTTDSPCPMCLEMASRPPVAFNEDFLPFGSELVVNYEDDEGNTKVLKQVIDYEELEAGNLHVNCGCKYLLIVE